MRKLLNCLIFIIKIYIYISMLDKKFDSYGYDEPVAFVPLAEQKKLKYEPVKRVPQEYTEIESFISNAGQPATDLVQPIIGCE